MSSGLRIWDLVPAQFSPHPLHTQATSFSETNCYIDVWVGLLSALGLEPQACLGVGLCSDFEGDQWTFVKPSHGDLDRLYGVRVEELSLWRSMLDHLVCQVKRQRIPLVEMDAFFLPDTQGTDYGRSHVKTTIGITHIDVAGKGLRYFHNSGFFELSGADFDGIFRLDRPTPDDYLPPFCELVKVTECVRRPDDELRRIARELDVHHLSRRPKQNPLTTYAQHLDEHLRWIIEGDEANYHRYGFSSLRQLGAAFDVLAFHLRWLDGGTGGAIARSADAFAQIAPIAKRVLLKLARVAMGKRPVDLSASFAEMAESWERGMAELAVGLQ